MPTGNQRVYGLGKVRRANRWKPAHWAAPGRAPGAAALSPAVCSRHRQIPIAEDVIGESSPSTLPPPASMPSLSGPGSPSGGTLPVPVLAVPVPPVPVSMTSLSETGSEGMPMALPSPESMTVVLSARDACQPQNARG